MGVYCGNYTAQIQWERKMQFLVLNLTVRILTTRINAVIMRNAVPVPNTETTVTTAHRLGGKTRRILVNNQLDALFLMYVFISLPYMFRAPQCSISGESNCVNTSPRTYHSV